jgi:AAA family ATP:ADP antiporter
MVLPVRQGERQLTAALFLHSLFAVGAFLTGRVVRDALFLAHGDKTQLAWMYVASAVAVTLFGLFYSPLAARVRRDRVALVSAVAFAAAFVFIWFAERSGRAWVYPALYIFVEVMGSLVLVQFWTLSNELFNARDAKRLYGLIGAGGTISNIVFGIAAMKISTAFGANALLLVCAALLVGTAAASAFVGRLGRQRLFAKAVTARSVTSKRQGGASRVFASGHLRTVALLAAITFFTTTLVDFQFKVIASNTYSENQLAAFFGLVSVVVGVLALVLQIFGTGRLLNRAGVIGSLALLPLSLIFGNFALMVVPALWAATLAKGADTLFRYSVNDPTTQILYLPIAPQARASAKAFIDSVVKPVAIGVCGVGLAGYRVWLGGNPYHLAWVAFLLSGVWLAIVASLRSQYIRSLQDNLRNRRLDLESGRHRELDGSSNGVLVRALSSADSREVLNALELLPHLENVQLDHRIEALLDHPVPEIRIASLEYYGKRQTMRFANSIFRKFEDPDAKVRAAAIDAFSAIGRDKAVRSVRPHLSDPDPGIRSAAVTGMIRYGGLDGVLVAAEALKTLIAHKDAVMRAHAAKVLGAIGVKNFYQPVLQLMNDPDPSVRRHAVNAAASLRSPEFVIPLIYKTQSIETVREAVTALSSYGSAIIPTLTKVLGNSIEDPQIRRAIAKVLGRLGTAEAVQTITRHLEEPDEELRTRLYRALARSVRGRRLLLADKKAVYSAIEKEFDRAYRTLLAAETLGLEANAIARAPRTGERAAAALLGSALAEEVSQTETRIFLLLAVLYPDADMEHIHAGIHGATAVDAPRRRSNAVELLDNLLERDLKKKFLPLLDELPRAERLRLVADVVTLPRRTKEETLQALCKDEAAWVRACALWYLAQARSPRAVECVLAAGGDPSSVVREIALTSLAFAAPEQAEALAESHLTDEAPAVRRQAALIATRRAAAV